MWFFPQSPFNVCWADCLQFGEAIQFSAGIANAQFANPSGRPSLDSLSRRPPKRPPQGPAEDVSSESRPTERPAVLVAGPAALFRGLGSDHLRAPFCRWRSQILTCVQAANHGLLAVDSGQGSSLQHRIQSETSDCSWRFREPRYNVIAVGR